MGITVGDALILPELSKTKLIAGSGGTDREIKWMTILEIIEDISRIQEGEFLITTGYGLNKREEDTEKLMTMLAKQQLSAVAVHTGTYLHAVPDRMIEAANKYELPLIEIPKNMNFSFITKVILEKVVNSEFKLITYSQHIYQELTSLVLQNYGMSTITRKLAELTRSRIQIFDEFGEQIDSYPRSNSCQYNKTHRGDSDPFSFPIFVDERLYGFLSAHKEEPFSQYDQLAIQQATTIYAIEFLKLKIVDDTKLYLQGDFLDDLISQSYVSEQAATERGQQLGYDLTKQNSVILVQTDHLDEVVQTANSVMKAKNQICMLRKKPDHVVILHLSDINTDGNDELTAIYTELINQYRAFYPNDVISIGIGNTVEGVEAVAESARQAHYALLFTKYMDTELVRYEELGAYQLFIQLKDSGADLKAYYQPVIGALIDYDKSHQSNLIGTFEAYVEHNLKLKSSADALYIHRHTLTYRLEQIKKKTGIDIHKASERTQLHLAIIAFRIDRMLNDKVKSAD